MPFIALFPIISEAQEVQKIRRINPNIPYTFSSENSTYAYLKEGTVVPALSADHAVSYELPIGFPFQLGCDFYTGFYASSNGTLSFNNSFIGENNTSYILSMSRYANLTLLAPLWDDLNGDHGIFSYKTEGIAPNRVFTAEWKNWKWYYNASSAVISFQVKLYEGSNAIEYVYNQEPTPNTIEASASIGIYNDNTLNAEAKQLWLNNTSESPVASTSITENINVRPASGQLYRFTRNDTNVSCDGVDYYGQTIINPKGGTNANDGLRIILSGAANMQIRRNGKGQVYNPANNLSYGTTRPYNVPGTTTHGVVLAVGNSYFTGGMLKPASVTEQQLEVVSSTPQNSIESSPGHFVNEIKLAAVKNGLRYYLTVKYVYNFPENDFYMDYTVTIPEGNTEEVKLAHGWDTYLQGNDRGPGFISGTAPNLVVGVKREPSYEAFEFLEGIPWSGYFSAYYSLLNSDLGSEMTFKNTIDSDPNTDNGIGISMNFGKIPGSFTSSNKLVFACEAGDVAPALADRGGICQGGVLNLNSLITSPTPPGTVLIWKDSKDEDVADPTTVTTEGTYKAYYHSVKYDCDSPTAATVVTHDTSCGVCYRPGADTGTEAGSLTVISTLDRKNHPAVNPRNGALILESKEKGFAISKVASPETAIATPVEGMLVFDTTSNCLKLYNGISWNCIEQTCVDND
ncbi:hypothetical protein [Flavobacterium sp. 140616W15]|uniref:hypothetical protein n=1 Tax=Flavobacterium sp. 140616W15 TaxID=2478552 RepID=UPI000F0C37F9|nr:hypothetical protein [Flavobacterium sp. 140616W15]AYN03802.1 hypothetical protein EAG11_06115 [Flavobacterium sp. 140616W15]